MSYHKIAWHLGCLTYNSGKKHGRAMETMKATPTNRGDVHAVLSGCQTNTAMENTTDDFTFCARL